MNIEAGKKYVTRDGRTVGPAEWHGQLAERSGWPWALGDGILRCPDGKAGGSYPVSYDLIAEYVEPKYASPVDVCALKEGDAVLVRCRVNSPMNPASLRISLSTSIPGATGTVFAELPDIVSVEVRPLTVGGKVRMIGLGEEAGEIVLIEADEACVRREHGGLDVWPLDQLVRA